MRQPRTVAGKRLLRDAFRHDKSCFVHQGMDCGRCSLPEQLRNAEDEAMAPFITFAAYVEGRTKPMSVLMSGDTSGHAHSEPRSKEIWNKANALLNSLYEEGMSSGACVCGIEVQDHKPERIRYCHFGYHTLDCSIGGGHA